MESQKDENTYANWLLGSETVAEYELPRNRVGKRRLFNLGWWIGQSIFWNVVDYSIFAPYTYGFGLEDSLEPITLDRTILLGLILQTVIHALLIRKYFSNKRGNLLSIILMPLASVFGIVFFHFLPWMVYDIFYDLN